MEKDEGITFRCIDCRKLLRYPRDKGGAGFGLRKVGKAEFKFCYNCCAHNDLKDMAANGYIKLYLSMDIQFGWKVNNWPGTLQFQLIRITLSDHNMGLIRRDGWFNGPDDKLWHMVQIGEENQIAHCRRTQRGRAEHPHPKAMDFPMFTPDTNYEVSK